MEPRDVIFCFFQLTWAAARRRGMYWAQDRLVAALLNCEDVGRLLLVNAPRSAPVWLIKGKALGRERALPPPPAALWQPLRLRRRDPMRVPQLERAFMRYDRRLRAVAERQGMTRAVVITTDPFVAGFAPLDWAGPVTLYATDDMAEHPSYASWAQAYRTAYARTSARGRAVCAVSQPLMDRMRPTGPAALVPNGIDPAEWMEPEPPPSWFEQLPRPRFLYVGTLDQRIDVGAVESLAGAFPDASVVFVGPGGKGRHSDRLRNLDNFHEHGPVGRSVLPALVRAADVGLLPHARTALTKAMSPLKLYEYLAAGVPVAATDLPPIRAVSTHVHLARRPRDFATAARQALAGGPIPEPERRSFLIGHSWASRHEEILRVALRPRDLRGEHLLHAEASG